VGEFNIELVRDLSLAELGNNQKPKNKTERKQGNKTTDVSKD
jgi:hypothetical protein